MPLYNSWTQKGLALLVGAGVALATLDHDVLVKLNGGRTTIQGTLCPGSDVRLFRGIPYAQPPTGNLRFMPPQPLNGSSGYLNATKAAPPCIQYGGQFTVTNPTPSEDCLTVDVYVPGNATASSALPVKVWAYGGSNTGGATSYPLYDACGLATDAVVVEYNYRLGPLGYLASEDAGIQGNMAVQDALAALQWVKANIEAFGGDHSRVVLFGQSSGADNAHVLSTLPEIKGLISAVAISSGGGQDVNSFEKAQETGRSFIEALGCCSGDLPCLQSKSVDDIVAAYLNTSAIFKNDAIGQDLTNIWFVSIPGTFNFQESMLDGKIVKENPLKVGSQVPLLAGATHSDSNLFAIPLYLSSDYAVTESNYTDFLAAWGPTVGPWIASTYPLSLFNATGSTEEAVIGAVAHVTNQAGFICPTYRALRSAASDTYAYRFNHTPSCPWLLVDGMGAFPSGEELPLFGATHTSDLPFIFHNLRNQPFGQGTCNATAAEDRLSATMVAAWTAIASHGSPATAALPWPRFDACGETNGVYIAPDASANIAVLDYSECAFWDKVWVEFGGFNVTATPCRKPSGCRVKGK